MTGRALLIAVLTLTLAACGPMPRERTPRQNDAGTTTDDAGEQLDAGHVEPDSGHVEPDAGNVNPDAGHVDPDGGNVDPDAGHVEPDGGNVDPDAGHVEPDGGNVDPDAGHVEPDAGTNPDVTSIQLTALRLSCNGLVSLPVEGATVTYVRPRVGYDDPGFFIQAERGGPAVFVNLDPATLSPPPVAGNRVDFVATNLLLDNGACHVMALEDWFISGTGSVPDLVEDVTSRVDLVSAVGDYESELVRFDAVVSDRFFGAGFEHVSATIDTAGVQANDSLKLRIPTVLRDATDLNEGCAFTLNGGPLWRYNSQAQPSAYALSELSIQSCPAPRIVAAEASSRTSVSVEFSRIIDPSSIIAPATQFAFDGGLGVTGAQVDGRKVTLTTTEQQAARQYTLTVTNVKDSRGSVIASDANTATIDAWMPLARLAITEVNQNQPSGRELIELTALTAGSIGGLKLQLEFVEPHLLATLPDITVAQGDLIVVHMVPNGPFNAPGTETLSKTEHPASAYSANYDSAWDVNGTGGGIANTYRVLFLAAPGGAVQDAVAFANSTWSGTPPSGFPADLQGIQALGLWTPADCAGLPCAYDTLPSAVTVSAEWNGTGNTSTGDSVRRVPPFTSPGSQTQWSVGPSSFGLPNQ